MARPRTRTEFLPPLYGTAMKNLLTPQRAYKLLNLEGEVTYDAVRRAFQGEPLTPEEHDAIKLAWEQWTNRYLKDPSTTVFTRLRS